MPVENIQGKTFDPVGRCIYCGSDGGEDGLRTEHIMPFSLGGNAKLPKASCRSCEEITSYLDGYLARHIFADHRLHTGTQTRRPKERPTTRPANILIAGKEEVREFAIPDHPHHVILPVLREPGILVRVQPDEKFEMKVYAYEYIPENFRKHLNVDPTLSVQVHGSGNIKLVPFARAIAKIAYCHSVANWGIDVIRPLDIPGVILGKCLRPSYYVGGEIDDPPPPTLGSLHRIQFETVSQAQNRFLVVSVRLFANRGAKEHGFPIYRVVMGVPKSL